MKLILQIAVGVFLGGMGVVIVLRPPAWVGRFRLSSIWQRSEAMAPEELISKCGTPVTDTTEPFRSASVPGPLQRRIVYYKAARGVGVALTFDQQEANEPFRFVGMRIATPRLDSAGGTGEKITDDGAMASLLPCLSQR